MSCEDIHCYRMMSYLEQVWLPGSLTQAHARAFTSAFRLNFSMPSPKRRWVIRLCAASPDSHTKSENVRHQTRLLEGREAHRPVLGSVLERERQ
jgi:hypothetical protein